MIRLKMTIIKFNAYSNHVISKCRTNYELIYYTLRSTIQQLGKIKVFVFEFEFEFLMIGICWGILLTSFRFDMSWTFVLLNISVTSPTRESCAGSDYVKPTSTSGYIASVVTEETGCGATETPWLLQALPGKLNLIKRYLSQRKSCLISSRFMR